MKQIKIIQISIILLLSLVSVIQVTGASFGAEVLVCSPYWYCTVYSAEDCGTRTCIDINSCGTNLNKPSEVLECVAEPGGLVGNSEGSTTPITSNTPEGYFTLNIDVIKLSIEQDKVIQRIISVNSTESKEYTLEIEYPSSYTKGTDFLTTSSNKKQINNIGDFNVIIDTRSILVGTYVIPINIYNDKYSRKIVAIIDVIPSKNADIIISLDTTIKILNIDKEIVASINIKDKALTEGDDVTYYIINPKGNIIFSEEKNIESKHSIEKIQFPEHMEEGQYTLSMKVESASGTYTKSRTFVALTPNKYIPVLKIQEKNINTSTIIIGILIISIILGVILFYIGVFNPSYGRRRRHSRLSRWWFSWNMPSINFNFKKGDLMNKLKKLSQVFKLQKKDREYQLEMLRNSYEKGFISLKEYRDSLKEQGFTIEAQKVANHYDELKNKERIEGLIAQSEKEKGLKVNEEQKKAIERAQAEVLKQEAQLKREIEEEKKQQEAKEREQRIREKEEQEAEKNKKQRESYGDSMLIQQTHIISKDNILDKKVSDDKAFVLTNGEKLYSVRDLLNALHHNSEQTVHYHTKYGRHDFANWVRDVFRYHELADDLRKVTDKDDLIKVLKKYD